MIISVPNPILTTPAKPVARIDKKTLRVLDQMKSQLVNAQKPKGVGLAATQIGIPLQIFITKPTSKSPIDVFINPEILWKSKELTEIIRPKDNGKTSAKDEKKLEGCLSIPNIWGYLKRSSKVKLRYTDIKGNIQEKEFDGFMAIIIQHETDHLNGILFTRRVLEQKQKLYKIEEDDKGNEKLIEMKI